MITHAGAIFERFAALHVLVVGDAMVDSYLRGTARRLTPEAPAPVVDVAQRYDLPGGASITAAYVQALGARVEMLAVIGRDEPGRRLVGLLDEAGVGTDPIVIAPDRQTLIKQRVLADGQHLVRFDQGSTHTLDRDAEASVVDRLAARFAAADVIIVSDYDYAAMSAAVIARLRELQAASSRLLVIDAKRPRAYREVGATAAKPNYQQALTLMEEQPTIMLQRRADSIEALAGPIMAAAGTELVAVTLDAEGSVILQRGAAPHRTPTWRGLCLSPSGAGDSYLAAFALALAADADPAEAGDIASAAASLVVAKQDTAVCSIGELKTLLACESVASDDFVDIARRAEAYRRAGKRIAFTNGCFDLVHPGHVDMLQRARALGDVLVVGLNSDASVRRLKGPNRPVNSAPARAAVLAALRWVDEVVTFDDDVPLALISAIRPDVYVKGADYTVDMLPEAPLVQSWGGRVEILPYLPDHSTTRMVTRMQAVA
jgi:D-beta-D-heptose 7-phosphate kinase/D-beta-D-heptose 1-phosphate adenosyltransferase